jgi:hypothetical protein
MYGYGMAFPTVTPPTMVPTAKPRSDLNQVEIIFIAGGYTPARQKPHMKRVAAAGMTPATLRTAPFTTAPASAASEKSSRADRMSARFSTAIVAVPATKPSCTEVVSHPTWEPLSAQRSCSCGAIAVPANQSDMPSSSASPSSARIRQRPGWLSGATVWVSFTAT